MNRIVDKRTGSTLKRIATVETEARVPNSSIMNAVDGEAHAKLIQNRMVCEVGEQLVHRLLDLGEETPVVKLTWSTWDDLVHLKQAFRLAAHIYLPEVEEVETE